jgi:NADPH:quinone reductase-like Zn-dependent oxidoreductase
MKRVVCVRVGEELASSVEVVEAEAPTPGPRDVRVRVQARPINPADELLLTGRHVYQPTYPAPVGIEGAGVVIEAGPEAGLAVGTRVALPYGGTWTEELVLPAEVVVALPDALDLEQGAMLSVNPMTAVGLLEGRQPGAVVLVNAATSAIGQLVVRLGARRGLTMFAAVRRLEAAAALRSAGASAVFADDDELPAAVRAVTGNAGVDLALDAVAGTATTRLYHAVKDGGELIVYGLLSDDRAILPAASLVFRDVTVRGYSRLRSYAALTPQRRRELGAEIVAAMCRGEITTPVEARYPLTEVHSALRHQARPERRGKILLVSEP